MGVRFACHACGKQLNIKSELAGRRGICPGCSSRFRIPLEDTDRSTPIEEPQRVMATPSVPRAAVPHAAQPESATAHAIENQVSAETTSGAVAIAPTSPSPTTQSSPSLDLLVSDPSATWYVRPPSGGQYGPASGEILKQWIDEGRVASNALLWRDGWPQWREATEALPEIAQQLPDSNAAPVSGTPNQGIAVAAAQQTVVPANTQPASTPIIQTASQSSSRGGSVGGEEFGYEDSDFAARSQPTSYGGPTSTDFKGSGRVGSKRREKASKRTLTIVLLGLLVIVLIAALAYVMTR